MESVLFEELRAHRCPIVIVVPADIAECIFDALLHVLESADKDVSLLVQEKIQDTMTALANQILHILFGLARYAREREVYVDEIFGKPG